jgi:small-conductance mechanosensitive channel
MTSSLFRRLAAFAFVLCMVLVAVPASAQRVGSYGTGIAAEQQKVLEELDAKVQALSDRITASAEDDALLVEVRTQLEEVGRALLASALAFRPRLSEINGRLEQLGPAPAEGQPAEPDIVSLERQSLVSEKAEINVLVGQAETLSIRVSTLVDRIAELRRQLFANLLTKRYDVNYALFGEVEQAFHGELADLVSRFSSWLSFIVQFKLRSVTLAGFFALVAAAILLIGGRRVLGELFEPDPEEVNPSLLGRLSVAFWSTLLPSAAFAVFLAATYVLFDYFAILRTDIGNMIRALFYVAAIVFFVHRLARAVLAPRLPQWRLIPVQRHAGQALVLLVTATAFFTGLDFLSGDIFKVLGSPLALTVAESLVATVLTGVLLLLIGLVKPFVDAEGAAKPWHPALRYLLFALGIGTITAALLGYIGLARFASQQVVFTGAILVTMYIGFLSGNAISEEGAFAGTALGRRWGRWFKVDETVLDQMGLVASVTINILILVIGLPLILLLWGFQPDDIRAWLYRMATEVTVGSVTFSLVGILTGVLVFVIGYFVTRWFQGWIDGSVMARGKVDAGVRNSIRTAIGYAGVALAALVGISAAGIDLSNLALVAGALSLGIGFGLQNVVSNFVSGLILLAERPFKVGDWIIAGPVSGTVKKISVRATEIETFQRQTMILPNSELINAAVGNWTHKNRLGRVEIPVGVAYGTDPRKVHDLLLGIARDHPAVLKNPEPFVYFGAFGESSLDFEVRFFLSDILNSLKVQNDIRFAIVEAFDREKISIPFPHREILVRSLASGGAETGFPPAPPADEAVPEEQAANAAGAGPSPEPGSTPGRPKRRRRTSPE